MTLHLLLGQKLDTPRKLRFPGRFLDDIASLVGSVGLEVITRVHKVRGVGPLWWGGGGRGAKGRHGASQVGCQSARCFLATRLQIPFTGWVCSLNICFLKHLLCAQP